MKTFIPKLFEFFITLFLALSLIFFMLRLAPGDPIERILGPEAAVEQIQSYRTQLGLDLSLTTQYTSFLKSIVQFDFGESLFKKKPIIDLLKIYFPPTITLAFLSIFFSFFIGSFVGVFMAINRGNFRDTFLRTFSLLGLSFPIFSLAPVLIYIFAIKFRLLPVSEWNQLSSAVLPTLTLTIPLSTILMRVTRARFLEDLAEPWVQVLKSKGLSMPQIHRRVFKASLPSVINVVALQLSVVLGGTIITETIFDIPGIGLLLFEAIQNRDYPLVQGVAAYITIIYMGVYFLAEYVNEKIDPRIKIS